MHPKIAADMHVHSATSPDGKDDILAMCAAAREAALAAVCFSEHHDAYTPKWCLDLPAHEAAVARARAAYPGLRVLKGIEAGYSPECASRLLADIAALRPDFVLLSIHAVDGVDPYFAERFFAGRSRPEGMRAYLRAVLTAARDFADYDAVAHIGYAGRYAPPGEEPVPLRYADAPELIDEVLTTLIRRDKALEVNTSGIPAGRGSIPGEDILARYRELGGRLLTLGSDAHAAASIAGGFDEARRMLLGLGFTAYCAYEGRVRQELPLG